MPEYNNLKKVPSRTPLRILLELPFPSHCVLLILSSLSYVDIAAWLFTLIYATLWLGSFLYLSTNIRTSSKKCLNLHDIYNFYLWYSMLD